MLIDVMTQGKFTGSAENNSCNVSFTLLKLIKIKLIFILLNLLACSASENNNSDFNFDNFILSSRWLPTACIELIEKNTSSYKCHLPKNYTVWTIHGLWPESKNHNHFFCNTSLTFNITSLTPIKNDLDLYWPDIEKQKSSHSLWKHEWLKHGTCSVSVTSLNTELKYFNETLNKFKLNNMNEKFAILGTFPSSNEIFIADFLFNLKKLIGKNFHLQCITEAHTGKIYLSAIQLCFDKNLTLMDCDVPQTDSVINQQNLIGSTTNCPLNAPVIYPDKVDTSYISDSSKKNEEKTNYYYRLINVLRGIRFLQWVFL